MKKSKIPFAMLFLSSLSACGGSGIEVRETPQITPPPTEACLTTSESFQTAEIQNNLFNLGTDFPTDLKFTPNGEALAVLSLCARQGADTGGWKSLAGPIRGTAS